MRNLDGQHCVANGTPAVFTEIGTHSVFVRLLRNGRSFIVPSVSCGIQANGMKAVRQQVPLRLGYAITVHAAQGKTIGRDFLIPEARFLHGQLYVALSGA